MIQHICSMEIATNFDWVFQRQTIYDGNQSVSHIVLSFLGNLIMSYNIS